MAKHETPEQRQLRLQNQLLKARQVKEKNKMKRERAEAKKAIKDAKLAEKQRKEAIKLQSLTSKAFKARRNARAISREKDRLYVKKLAVKRVKLNAKKREKARKGK